VGVAGDVEVVEVSVVVRDFFSQPVRPDKAKATTRGNAISEAGIGGFIGKITCGDRQPSFRKTDRLTARS